MSRPTFLPISEQVVKVPRNRRAWILAAALRPDAARRRRRSTDSFNFCVAGALAPELWIVRSRELILADFATAGLTTARSGPAAIIFGTRALAARVGAEATLLARTTRSASRRPTANWTAALAISESGRWQGPWFSTKHHAGH
jgi:hypothetical protein